MKATFNRYRWLPFNMIAMTVVAGGIILFGLSKLENYLVDRTGRDLQWVSMEIAEKIDLLLAERLGDMQLISGLLSKVNSEKRVQEWNRHFEQLREAYPIYAWIGVLDKAGRVVAATDSKTIGKEVVGAQWEGSRNTNASVTIQEYQRDPLVDGYKTIGFAAAVTSSGVQGSIGSFEGTIVTRIKLSELDAMVTRSLREMREKMQSRQGMEYQVINRHGGVLIESLRQDNGNTNLIKLGVKSAKYATTGETGFVIEHHARRAVQVLTGYAPIPEREDFPPLGWGILVRVDHLDVLGPIREMVRTITWWGVATFIPMWILLIWTMRQLRAEWQQTVEAQQASEEAHNLIQSVLDNASDAHIILNEGGIVKGWNPKAEAVFGWSAEEAMGRLMADLCHAPTDRKQSAGKDLGAVLTIGVRRMLTERTTYDCWRKDGNLFPVDVSMTAVRGPHGFQYSIFARDITEQKQEDWYKNAEFQIAELLLINSSLEGASRAVIRTLCQMFEWKVGVLWLIDENKESLGYVEGWHVADEGLEAFLDESQHIRFKPGEDLPGKVVASKKVEWVKDVGTEKSCARSTVAMRLGLHGACAVPIKIQGKVRGVIEFFSNAMREPDQQLLNFFSGLSTQFSHYFAREVMQQQLETSEARFSGMVQMADDAIISIDDAQRIVVFNRGAETIFDYTAEEVVGRSLDVLLPEELRASHRHSVNAFAGSGLTSKSMADRREIQGHRKNGEAFPAEASIAKVTVKGETTYTVILRDISKRKREEEALRASKHRAEELVNQKRTLLA
ncbi:MAG: PAS domain S-box protein, partial [Nitrospira sp.]|nr:PAS domain S-box protein [Nitrospira sp.]